MMNDDIHSNIWPWPAICHRYVDEEGIKRVREIFALVVN